MLTVLAGGIGAAKFLDGLAGVVPPESITVIANTGDGERFHGLHVSPDIDTVIYTLADVTGELCAALGVGCRILPMTNDPAATRVRTPQGVLPFQEYFVKLGQRPEVLEVDLTEASASSPAPGVLEAIAQSDAIILAPSNPFISIGPILAVRGIRDALRETRARAVAISPIVGGKALKGPADRMLKSLGFESSAVAVAELYREFVDLFVVDLKDAVLREEIEGKDRKSVV